MVIAPFLVVPLPRRLDSFDVYENVKAEDPLLPFTSRLIHSDRDLTLHSPSRLTDTDLLPAAGDTYICPKEVPGTGFRISCSQAAAMMMSRAAVNILILFIWLQISVILF